MACGPELIRSYWRQHPLIRNHFQFAASVPSASRAGSLPQHPAAAVLGSGVMAAG